MPDMRHWGWGTDAHAGAVDPAVLAWLGDELGGLPAGDRPPVALEAVRLRRPAATRRLRAALVAACGASEDAVRDDHAARVLHAAGKSYPDLVRMRAGAPAGAPDLVVTPADDDQVAAVLRACAAEEAAVVPFGGGTSVVGGVDPVRGGRRAVVTLDLRRLHGLVSVDHRSLTATLRAGTPLPDAERLLGEHGLTLGHHPQSFEHATVGGCVATRSAGQASTGYGRIDRLVTGVSLVAPAGELRLPAMPGTAAGPDLRQVVVGSEGVLGVVTDAALRVRPAPTAKVYEACVLPSFAVGCEAFREAVQSGVAPDVARLSDEEETRFNLALAGLRGIKGAVVSRYLAARGVGGGSLMIVGWEGTEHAVRARREATWAVLRAHRAVSLGTGPGNAWARGRYHGPYLRDALLGRGVFVETLETAAPWSALPALHAAVGGALHAEAPLVGCHVSHLYPTGASLYFTFLARAEEADPIAQWRRTKAAACEAIVAAGGTITHHHAVGRDHRPWLPAETGALGLDLLRAVKAQLDPAGVMNPGKLV